MTFTPRTRFVNPRLGSYFSIFASALAALFFLAVIFEQLGMSDRTLRWLMLAGPVLLYGAIGLMSATGQSLDYFAAGRRVPSAFTGLALATTALGATGLVSLTGVFFVGGFDGLAITIGGLAGFVVMAVLLAPFLRKFGAYTLASYLGRRFESRALRLLAAALLSVPLMLLIAAELRIGAYVAGWLVDKPPAALLPALAAVLFVTLVAGGMRSLSWSNAAQAITVLLAFLVPAAIVALLVTKIPLPQLSYGPIVRSLIRQEAAVALPAVAAHPLAFDLPGEGFSTIAKRFATPFGAIGSGAFVITMLMVMAGIASAPWLLPRVSATPSVYDARKSLSWATFVFGVLVLTMTSVAAFLRDPLMDLALSSDIRDLPEWLARLQSAELARVTSNATRIAVKSVEFARDGVFLALPMATGLPSVLIYLAAASAIAAALACASATATALGNLLAEDIVSGLSWQPPADNARLLLARAGLAVAVACATGIALVAPTDPLKLLLWSITITGATAFPVLVMSIWWKRINGFGAFAGLATGFLVATVAIVASEAGLIDTAGTVAAGLAIPVGVAAAMLVSVMTPPPSRHALELVRDIRVPGGEILYDMEMRRLRLKKSKS